MDSTLNHSILCTLRNPTLSNIDRLEHSPGVVAVAVVEAMTVARVRAVAAASEAGGALLDTDGVGGIVGAATSVGVLLVLVAEVIVVGTVVPGTEGVGPTAIAVVALVDVSASGVVASGVAEGVASEANGVALSAGDVLVATVAHASALGAVSAVVVAVDGVESDVDLAGVVAPLVINGFLGIPMVVGSPLVPCVVNPLVVALTLMAGLSVRVMGVNVTGRADGLLSVTIATITGLMAVVLVVSTVGTWLTLVVIGSLPGGNGGDSKGKGEASEHFKDLEIYIKENFKAFK